MTEENIVIELKEYHTGVHKDCDNLWQIAYIVYGDGNKWNKIVELNKETYPELQFKKPVDRLRSDLILKY